MFVIKPNWANPFVIIECVLCEHKIQLFIAITVRIVNFSKKNITVLCKGNVNITLETLYVSITNQSFLFYHFYRIGKSTSYKYCSMVGFEPKRTKLKLQNNISAKFSFLQIVFK